MDDSTKYVLYYEKEDLFEYLGRKREWIIHLKVLLKCGNKLTIEFLLLQFRELYIGCASGSFHESTDGSESPFELMLADLKVMSKSSILNMLEDSILDIQGYFYKLTYCN